MAQKQGNAIQVLSSYAISLEQSLLHWTFAIFGASVGLLQGTYHAAQRLQPHFTSTAGAKQLIYGVNHPEREHLSVTDLIKSWIPGYTSTGHKASESPTPLCGARVPTIGLKDVDDLQLGHHTRCHG